MIASLNSSVVELRCAICQGFFFGYKYNALCPCCMERLIAWGNEVDAILALQGKL